MSLSVKRDSHTTITIETIEISVTHEIKIDGDKAWVKYGGVASFDGDADDARAMLSKHVEEGVLHEIEATIATVRAFTAH